MHLTREFRAAALKPLLRACLFALAIGGVAAVGLHLFPFNAAAEELKSELSPETVPPEEPGLKAAQDSERNPFWRDVATKRGAGLPEEAFTRAWALLPGNVSAGANGRD